MKIDLRGVPAVEAEGIKRTIKESDGATLELSGIISNAGASALAKALRKSYYLRKAYFSTLKLYGVGITNVGVAALAVALPYSNLRILKLGYNEITNKGAIALAEALPSSKLTELYLGGNRISDDGAIALAAALPNSKLTLLELEDNRYIGDDGARHFLSAIPRSKVTELWFDRNDVSKYLQEAINDAVYNRKSRDKLFLLLRLMVFWRFDGDNAMLHRIAGFLMR